MGKNGGGTKLSTPLFLSTDSFSRESFNDKITNINNDIESLKSNSMDITLNSTSWTGNGPWTYNVPVAGLTATQNGTVGLCDKCTKTQYQEATQCQIRKTGQNNGFIILTAEAKKPTMNIVITVTMLG